MAGKRIRRVTKLPVEKEKSSEKELLHTPFRAEIVSAILFMLAVFMLIALNNTEGIASDLQFIGVLGTYLSWLLTALFGVVALIAPLLLFCWSVHLAVVKRWWSIRMWGLIILTFSILIYVSIFQVPMGLNPWEASLKGMGGGYLGGDWAT